MGARDPRLLLRPRPLAGPLREPAVADEASDDLRSEPRPCERDHLPEAWPGTDPAVGVRLLMSMQDGVGIKSDRSSRAAHPVLTSSSLTIGSMRKSPAERVGLPDPPTRGQPDRARWRQSASVAGSNAGSGSDGSASPSAMKRLSGAQSATWPPCAGSKRSCRWSRCGRISALSGLALASSHRSLPRPGAHRAMALRICPAVRAEQGSNQSLEMLDANRKQGPIGDRELTAAPGR